jgi:phosphotransferase system  glucose/maltose/N-acetylglucosamine-specific IIC component
VVGLSAALLLPATASATSIFVEWTSASEGSGGGIDATVNATVNAWVIFPGVHPANDPVYVADFAAGHSALGYQTPSGGPADILSTLSFSSALPAGSRLIILDVDHAQETVTLTGSGAPLSLLTQLESIAGASSIFPSWDPVTGELVATTTPGQVNSAEASVFDVAGLTSFQVDFRNGNNSSTVVVAVALPIPEPSTLTLTLLGTLFLAMRARRPTRRCS